MKRFLPYLVLSLLFHLLVFFLTPIRTFAPSKEPVVWLDFKKGKYEVVDILPPLKEERPEEAEFLGMYDSLVSKETVTTENREQRTETVNRNRNGKQRTENREALSFLEKSQGQEIFLEDYLPDFHRGPHTYLNVLKFPDIQYFVMLKRVFKMTYNPIPSLREAYLQNRITHGRVEVLLGVSLDTKGQLAELFIFRESGIQEFDQEAMRTIRASAPFMIPPSKLLDDEGLLRMTWTFTVYL